MEIQKIAILTSFATVSIAVSLLVIQLLLGKARYRNDEAGNLRIAYAILFSTTFISFVFILNKCISLLSIAVDTINKITPTKALLEILKTSSIFIGLAIIWLIIWYYVSYVLATMITGKRNELYEMKNNNISHFLLRGCLQFGTVLSVSAIFEMLLQNFIPSVDVIFYH